MKASKFTGDFQASVDRGEGHFQCISLRKWDLSEWLCTTPPSPFLPLPRTSCCRTASAQLSRDTKVSKTWRFWQAPGKSRSWTWWGVAGGASLVREAGRSWAPIGCGQASAGGGHHGGTQPRVTHSTAGRQWGAGLCLAVVCAVSLHIWQNLSLLMLYLLLMSCSPKFQENSVWGTPWTCSLSEKPKCRCSWGCRDIPAQPRGARPSAPSGQGTCPTHWLQQRQAPHYGAVCQDENRVIRELSPGSSTGLPSPKGFELNFSFREL